MQTIDQSHIQNGKSGEERQEGKIMETDSRVKFHELFQHADRTDMVLMLVGTVSAVATGAAQPILMIIFGQMIAAFGDDATTSETIPQRVNKVVLRFVYLGVGAGIVSFLQVSCWTTTGERQATSIRSLFLKSVLRQDIAFFDLEMTTGQVISSASADTVLIQGAIGEKVGKILQLVTTFLGVIAVAFVKGWLLTLVMVSNVPLFIIAGGIVSRRLSKISGEGQKSYSDAGDIVEQTIGSIRTVVSFNGEKEAISQYNNQIKKAYKATVMEGATQGFGSGSLSFVYFSTFGLVIWYGTKLTLSRGYGGGDIISILFAIMIGGRAVGDATHCLAAFTDGRTAAHRLFKTIMRKPEIDSNDEVGIVLEDIKGDVELKNVYFSYPSRPDQLIFDGFSLCVSSGKTEALVGESGSGKSTVINLVERFYDPQAGEVCIDGINIKGFRLDWIRQKIGLVSQEPLLFTTSIKDNISYGREDATLEEIKDAADLASAAIFIEKLPNGYNSTVGQHGTQLSGGQKQRIAIARAILKTPRILLLDEATNALDLESERIVQNALNRVMENRTTLIVAHRLSTVMNADSISVVHQGKITEQGRHDELVKDPQGAYSQLIRLQEAHQEDYQLDVGISHSRSIRSLPLQQSTYNPAGTISRHTTLTPSLTASNESTTHNGTNSEKKNENNDGKNLKKASVGRLLTLNKQETSVLVFGSLAAAIHGALIPVTGFMLATAAKVFYEPLDKRSKDSRFWSFVCVGIGIISMVSRFANCFLFGIAGGKLIERIRALAFQSIVHQEIAWFDDSLNSSGALGGRLCIDALNLRRLVGDNLAVIIQCTASLLSGMTIAMISDWKLSLVIMFIIPLIGLQGYAQVKFVKGFSQDAKNAALVGQSGSGKSTIIALLERFYDPDSGTISLDGVDIKNLRISWLRDQMGLVSQEPVLFNATIRANIAYAKLEEVTEEEIIKVARAANAHEFISSMPQGYNSVVGERGTQLSGGQKQRVAIARAILKDPRILLLDEATSALDAESERVVQDALNQVMVSRTTITVSHRLSTIQGADMIAVLKDGMIVEKGAHETLIGIKGGAYASLVELTSGKA